jgi:hypothetical protein
MRCGFALLAPNNSAACSSAAHARAAQKGRSLLFLRILTKRRDYRL